MTDTAQEVWSAFSKIEPHLWDADRLTAIIGEMHSNRIAGIELHLTAEQYDFMIETLLDRLRIEIRQAKKIFKQAPSPRRLAAVA
jgi:hypothetical protein